MTRALREPAPSPFGIPDARPLDPAKFRDPLRTAAGETRAVVGLARLDTLWLNTGTLCNLACKTCYIGSSPTNDALLYLTAAEAARFLDEIASTGRSVREIGLTGGEPFMNPDTILILADALDRGFEALVLTNAMTPMRHRRADLLALKARHGERLTLRVSLDHHSQAGHEGERGPNSWARALDGLRWLSDEGFSIAVAGRHLGAEPDADARAAYSRLFAAQRVAVDAHDPARLVLFPEMDDAADVPEITTACWGILGKSPADVMCSTSRMVVHRKGEPAARVVACTLLPYADGFDLGATLEEADRPVPLNHPHCARFCVLGGASCSG